MTELLTAATVGGYLAGRGLLEPAAVVRARELGGGVSNVVIRASSGQREFVVKQALGRLRVADEWLATTDRAVTEAAALRWAAALSPQHVPTVVDVDPDACALVIAAAPIGWRDWKSQLLGGAVDPDLAASLGQLLGEWHTDPAATRKAQATFADRDAFVQLRIDPFYRTVAARRPDLAALIDGCADATLAVTRSFVHGDFSPKNVLVGPDGFWVIDFEVAHFGDPAFDVAFMLNHLLLKSVHLPAASGRLAAAAGAFLDAYRGRAGRIGAQLTAQLGCLQLARVHGKSPADYLTDEERRVVSRLGEELVRHPTGDPLAAWAVLADLHPVATAGNS
jgi:aminoglycoside phosphotransferase (APT) family kinase protein